MKLILDNPRIQDRTFYTQQFKTDLISVFHRVMFIFNGKKKQLVAIWSQIQAKKIVSLAFMSKN